MGSIKLCTKFPDIKSGMLWLYWYWDSLDTFLFGLYCITVCYIFLPIKDDTEFKGTGKKENIVNVFDQNMTGQYRDNATGNLKQTNIHMRNTSYLKITPAILCFPLLSTVNLKTTWVWFGTRNWNYQQLSS